MESQRGRTGRVGARENVLVEIEQFSEPEQCFCVFCHGCKILGTLICRMASHDESRSDTASTSGEMSQDLNLILEQG